MDVKEKLVALLKKAKQAFWLDRFNCDYYGFVADHLIAHGVTVQDEPIKIVIPEGVDEQALIEMIHNATVQIFPCEPVQEWISVKDRLPTIYDADADNCVLAIHKASNKRYYHWRSVADNPFDFTHWMRTPQPPKGE